MPAQTSQRGGRHISSMAAARPKAASSHYRSHGAMGRSFCQLEKRGTCLTVGGRHPVKGCQVCGYSGQTAQPDSAASHTPRPLLLQNNANYFFLPLCSSALNLAGDTAQTQIVHWVIQQPVVPGKSDFADDIQNHCQSNKVKRIFGDFTENRLHLPPLSLGVPAPKLHVLLMFKDHPKTVFVI